MDYAACRHVPTELFYPEQGRVSRSQKARTICMSCPVRKPCLDYAITEHERFGIWGGMTQKERRAEARRRR